MVKLFGKPIQNITNAHESVGSVVSSFHNIVVGKQARKNKYTDIQTLMHLKRSWTRNSVDLPLYFGWSTLISHFSLTNSTIAFDKLYKNTHTQKHISYIVVQDTIHLHLMSFSVEFCFHRFDCGWRISMCSRNWMRVFLDERNFLLFWFSVDSKLQRAARL